MNRIVVSFAAALMLGGSTAALAQQGKEGGGRPDSPGQSQAAPGQAAQGAGPAARGDRPGRSEARDGIGPQEQGRGGDRGAERRAQGKQDAPGRSSEGKQDRDRQAQDKQRGDRDRQAQDKQKQDRDRQAQDKQKQDRDRQAQDKQGQDRDRQAQDKQGQDRDRQAQDKQKQDRDRQAQDKQGQDRDRQAQDKQKQDRDRQAQDKQAPAGKGDRSDTATGPRADGARPDRVELSDNQRERVRREFREHRQRTNARHYRNVDVDIGVGRRAPRNWNYHPVPSFIIDVQPRYRGYRYVWVDDRYYIVHPSSYEIVAYVDDDSGYVYASGGRVGSSATGRGGGEAGRAGRCEVSLNEAERRRIIAAIDDWNPRPLSIGQLRIGIDLPSGLDLQVFPERIRTDFRDLEGCRYVPVANDRLLIVEADTRRVVAIVERR